MADSLFSDLNPYAAPRLIEAGPACIFRRNPEANSLHARRAWKGFVRREIRFSGEYEGLVDWNANGNWVTVSIDGTLAHREPNRMGDPRHQRVSFPVDVGVQATMTIEIRLRFAIFLRAFRIRLDGRTLYAEGDWPEEREATSEA